MTQATESITNVLPTAASGADRALRLARTTALSAARGTGQLGLFIGRQGVFLAKKGINAQTAPARKAARTVKVVVRPLTPDAPEQSKPRKGRRIAIGFAVGAVVAGGAVFARSRRREQPPVAPAPPSLQDAE
ncbi:MAG: hypothetical protein WAW17_01730, partial [Rhodococcus sp. (in: high G+C Gram-positive bacteria)]|uniref:hypothetical protein n=1 Tax=Rhodococcus sp. TaxID=1831 RepID=UPI003BB0C2CE